ncbi:hypothetical protein BC941DRAFT_451919 [Chlamydoabsidia padenii]|nr:hypothetical protein BC941DRAFT_451919 [Chlamydoabsidia padenii]
MYITSLDQVMVSLGLVKSLPMSVPGHPIIGSNRLPLDQVTTRGSCLFYLIKLPALGFSRLPWVNSLLVDQVASHGLSLFPCVYRSALDHSRPLDHVSTFGKSTMVFPRVSQPLDYNQEMEMVKFFGQVSFVSTRDSPAFGLYSRNGIGQEFPPNRAGSLAFAWKSRIGIGQEFPPNRAVWFVPGDGQVRWASLLCVYQIARPLDCNQELELVKMSHQIVLIARPLDCNQEMELVKMSHQIVLVIRLCLLEVLPTRQVGSLAFAWKSRIGNGQEFPPNHAVLPTRQIAQPLDCNQELEMVKSCHQVLLKVVIYSFKRMRSNVK